MVLEPLGKKKAKPNRSIEPDPEDPNFYCKSCSAKYLNRSIFRKHLRQTHKVNLKPLRRKNLIPNHIIKPDPDDPNFYCKSCATKYSTRSEF
jgi:ribosomal protein L31